MGLACSVFIAHIAFFFLAKLFSASYDTRNARLILRRLVHCVFHREHRRAGIFKSEEQDQFLLSLCVSFPAFLYTGGPQPRFRGRPRYYYSGRVYFASLSVAAVPVCRLLKLVRQSQLSLVLLFVLSGHQKQPR